MNWESLRLSEICREDSPITYGILQPGPEVENGVPYVRPSEIKGGQIDISSIRRTSPDIANRYKKSVIREGDILITIVGTIGHIATVPSDLDGGNITQSSARIRICPSKADRGYVRSFLRSPFATRQYDQHRLGVAVSRLNLHHVRDLQIPLPPLAEQKRIAGILDAADALRAKRRESLALLHTLLQSTFLDMFGDLATNPMEWEVCTLEEATTRVTDGTHQSPEWSESGLPFLFVTNIRDRQIDFQTTKFISEEEHERLTARCPIEVGDVLYTTVGSYGNPARVREGTGRFAFQRHIAHIKPRHDLIDPQFLEVMLDSPVGRNQADRLARGVAQKTLNLRELKSFKVALPPLDDQRRFAAIVESVEQQEAGQRAHLAELDTLFASLQSRAFRGDL